MLMNIVTFSLLIGYFTCRAHQIMYVALYIGYQYMLVYEDGIWLFVWYHIFGTRHVARYHISVPSLRTRHCRHLQLCNQPLTTLFCNRFQDLCAVIRAPVKNCSSSLQAWSSQGDGSKIVAFFITIATRANIARSHVQYYCALCWVIWQRFGYS